MQSTTAHGTNGHSFILFVNGTTHWVTACLMDGNINGGMQLTVNNVTF